MLGADFAQVEPRKSSPERVIFKLDYARRAGTSESTSLDNAQELIQNLVAIGRERDEEGRRANH